MRTIGECKEFSLPCRVAVASLFAAVLAWTPVEAKTIDVGNYIVQGYSVIGPIPVESVSSGALALYALPRSIKVKLEGKNVTVMTLDRQTIPVTRLEPGARVYVLQRAKEVLVYSLPGKAVRNDH